MVAAQGRHFDVIKYLVENGGHVDKVHVDEHLQYHTRIDFVLSCHCVIFITVYKRKDNTTDNNSSLCFYRYCFSYYACQLTCCVPNPYRFVYCFNRMHVNM